MCDICAVCIIGISSRVGYFCCTVCLCIVRVCLCEVELPGSDKFLLILNSFCENEMVAQRQLIIKNKVKSRYFIVYGDSVMIFFFFCLVLKLTLFSEPLRNSAVSQQYTLRVHVILCFLFLFHKSKQSLGIVRVTV